VQYEWDPTKARENRRKHGVDFPDAIAALVDPHRLEELDEREAYGEERTMTIGMAGHAFSSSSPLLGAWTRCASSRPEGQHDMKKTVITRLTVKPGSRPPEGDTDWASLDRMTDDEVVAAALADPDAQPLTADELKSMRRVSRVKALRQRLSMTQVEFADAYSIPVGTLRDWEQRRSTPDAPAQALLRAIERDPETMRRLLTDVA